MCIDMIMMSYVFIFRLVIFIAHMSTQWYMNCWLKSCICMYIYIYTHSDADEI